MPKLHYGEFLFAYWRNIHVFAQLVRHPFADRLQEVPGVLLHERNTRSCDHRVCPYQMEELGSEVWRCQGAKIIGTPHGSDEFAQTLTESHSEEKRHFVGCNRVGGLPDLRYA